MRASKTLLCARKTRGAFYDNFKDKEDVFLAIFEEDMARDLTESDRSCSRCRRLRNVWKPWPSTLCV